MELVWSLHSEILQTMEKFCKKNLQDFKFSRLQFITPDMYSFASRESVM